MKLTINLDIENNKELLCEQFGINPKLEDYATLLSEKLEKMVQTASMEYLEMVLGNKTFSRMNDLKEYRLLLFIENFFSGVIPNESEVASMFQIRTSEAKALLKSIESKYRIQLKKAIKKTLRSLINSIQENEGLRSFNFRCGSSFQIEQLNDLLAQNDIEREGNVDLIRKIDSKTNQYEITAESLSILKKVLQESENSNETR